MQDKLVEQAKKGESCCPNLDGKTRFIGFIITFIIGLVLSLCSIGSVFGIFLNSFGSNQVSWSAGLLTLGNVCCIASTFFLFGPKQQCAKMLEPMRAIVSLILLSSFILTMLSAFLFKIQWLTTIFVVIQFVSLIWYVFSYIPYAQDCCLKCTKQCCCGCCQKGNGEPITTLA